jgi:hypothetical protein
MKQNVNLCGHLVCVWVCPEIINISVSSHLVVWIHLSYEEYSKLLAIWYQCNQHSHASGKNFKEKLPFLLSYFKTKVVMYIYSSTMWQFSQPPLVVLPVTLPQQVSLQSSWCMITVKATWICDCVTVQGCYERTKHFQKFTVSNLHDIHKINYIVGNSHSKSFFINQWMLKFPKSP